MGHVKNSKKKTENGHILKFFSIKIDLKLNETITKGKEHIRNVCILIYDYAWKTEITHTRKALAVTLQINQIKKLTSNSGSSGQITPTWILYTIILRKF